MNISRRQLCATCLRASSACICQWIAPTANAVNVVILQHPLEVTHAKGSARLLHLSLQNSVLVTGEVFDPAQLQALLTGPKQSVLLYPDTPQHDALGVPPPPILESTAWDDPTALRLIVLDGTWRKSRKMLHRNPALHALPRLPLRDALASRYAIRKAREPHQLSTLEATCVALAQLEQNPQRYAPLLSGFDGFVKQSIEASLVISILRAEQQQD
jgi:DTW domain-containing protein YfiP